MTANGEVQIREEATVFVKELDLFVTVVLLEETPAVLSLGKLCQDHGHTYHWTSGQKPHLTKYGKKINCNMSNSVPFVVPGSSTTPTHHRIQYLTSADTPKIQYPKEVEVRVRSYGEARCINQQEPKTKIKTKDAKETLSLDIKTLPSHLMNFQWSREQKWNRVRVNTVYTRTFRRTQIVISA